MSKIVRAQYRATCAGVSGTVVSHCVACIADQVLHARNEAGELMHGSLFRYEDDLFAYLELIVDDASFAPATTDSCGITTLPQVDGLAHVAEDWFSGASYTLLERPGVGGTHCWAYMNPVFWHAVADDADAWAAGRDGVEPCGKIALLNPEKVASYVYHHQAIAAEGLLRGQASQLISLSGRVLFSHADRVEQPELVNLSGRDEDSVEIERWCAADPASHFVPLCDVPGKAFVEMETLAYV